MRSNHSDHRNAQLVRILRILRDLHTLGGADVYELAERTGVSTKTVRRDLAAIQSAGLPLVEATDGRRKKWRIAYSDAMARPAERIHTGHYLALRLAMEARGPARTGPATFAALEDLADRIDRSLEDADRQRLRAIESAFLSMDKFAYDKAPAEVFEPLIDAIADRRICQVRYQSAHAKQPKQYNVLPLRLFVHDAAPYLLATSPRHGSTITLNLQRLVSVHPTKRRGSPPDDFDPQAWASAAFGIYTSGPEVDFKLKFHRNVAQYIRERVWHPTQKLRKTRGGHVVLTFRCVDSYEVTSWVASWRESVTVIEPKVLRDRLADLGTWFLETYNRPPSRKRRDSAESGAHRPSSPIGSMLR